MPEPIPQTAASEPLEPTIPDSFEDLAGSRRQWIDDILRPWCRQATLKQLQQAAAEWLDIAGRVDIDATLWTWAWERFPSLTHEDLTGVDETYEVKVCLHDGEEVIGFPNSRASQNGRLTLCGSGDFGPTTHGPIVIDDIVSVERL